MTIRAELETKVAEDCEIFANLRVAFVSSSSDHPRQILITLAAVARCEAGADAYYPAHYPAHYGRPYAYAAAQRILPAPAQALAYAAPAPAVVASYSAAPAAAVAEVRGAPAVPSAGESSQYHAQDEEKNYSFGYANPNSARVEAGNALTGVTGSYSDGRRTYHYVADAHGFRHI